jgi:phosphatidylinositol glycan class B
MIYNIGYYILNILGLSDNSFLFKITPKITQAFIGASFDTLLIKLNEYYNGNDSNRFLVFLNLTNWITITYFSRTYVNSVETVLTTLAFYFWLLSKG